MERQNSPGREILRNSWGFKSVFPPRPSPILEEDWSRVARSPTIEELYREHARAIYAFLVSLCRDPVWAEDLMQDTFAKATLSLGGYRGGDPRSWLFAIARNVFLDDVRRRRPEPRREIVEGSVTDPDFTVRDLIVRVLERLPERQRSALLLADHAGLPMAELARTLGISLGATKVLVHRARINFRKWYDQEVRK